MGLYCRIIESVFCANGASVTMISPVFKRTRFITTLMMCLHLLVQGNAESLAATLTVQVTGDGEVSSSQGGISCPGTCSTSLTNGSVVSFSSFPTDNSVFSGWGGACAGLEICSLTLNQDTIVTALFAAKTTPVHVSGSFYGALLAGYDNVASGGVVMAVAEPQPGNLVLDRSISFTLKGGYDSVFSSNTGAVTEIDGSLTLLSSVMTIENIAIGPSAAAPASAPQNIKAASGSGQVSLTWDPVSGATSYNVYYATASGVTRATGTKAPGTSASTLTVSTLTNGTTYYFVVTSVNASGESIESQQVINAPAALTPQYIITDLGVGAAYGINNSGVMCGSGTGGGGAVYWTADHVLHQLPSDNGTARAIAPDGTIVGQYGGGLATVWPSGAYSTYANLSTGTIASAISSAGDVAGSNIYWATPVSSAPPVTLKGNEYYSAVNTVGALGVNSGHHIVGWTTNTSYNSRPVYWDNSTATPYKMSYPFGDCGQANAINNSGAIAGWTKDSTLTNVTHAVLWDSYSAAGHDLGVLGVRSPNIATAQALALNSSGVVVGTSSTSAGELHAFVASASAGMLDLNDISDAAGKSLVLYYAEGINDNGLIVGYGHSAVDGKNHAFLATPSH